MSRHYLLGALIAAALCPASSLAAEWNSEGPVKQSGLMVCYAISPDGFGVRFREDGRYNLALFNIELENEPFGQMLISDRAERTIVAPSAGGRHTNIMEVSGSRVEGGRRLYSIEFDAADYRLIDKLIESRSVDIHFTEDISEILAEDLGRPALVYSLAGSAAALRSAMGCIEPFLAK